MRILKTANTLALLGMIAVNYLSYTGFFNGRTTAFVSAEYANPFTPAGYAFSIWGLIYLGLLVFVLFQGRNREAVKQIGWWFSGSCAAGSLWLIAWSYEYIGWSVLIMAGLAFCLVKIVQRTRMEITNPPLKTIATVWWPFSLYAGWITVALFADLAAFMTKTGLGTALLPSVAWTIAMIGIAGIIYLLLTWTRNMREYALVGVWGLVAVAVANWHRSPLITRSALIISLILFVSSGLHGYLNRSTSPWKR